MRGGDKLLELVGTEPMLRRQARVARETCAHVLVTLRPNDPARLTVLQGTDVTILPVPDAAEGLAASIRAGASVVKNSALMILPADMPDLTTSDLRTLIDAFDQSPNQIIRAMAADGTPGHPVIFPVDCVDYLMALTGDAGARSVLNAQNHRISLIVIPDQHATTDLDTPEDWAAWRATQGVSR